MYRCRLINWSKTDSVNLILVGVAVVALLSGGIFSMIWTYPNERGSINNAVLEGWQYPTGSWLALNGQGCSSCIDGPVSVSVGPNSTAQYTVEFQAGLSPNTLALLRYSQTQDTYAVGPFNWNPPSSAFPSIKQYVVFTYSFQAVLVGGPQPRYSTVWFTGPQGNLSQTVHSLQYGGTDLYHGGLFGTSIIDVNGAGNYTLHYYNPTTSGSVNGTVVMGPSSVTFTRPYVYVGSIVILIAVAMVIAAGLTLRKKMRSHDKGQKL